MALLIQWPSVLTQFEFGSISDNAQDMSCAMFESWLLVHKDTLKDIRIGSVSNHGNNRVFNATLFPNLECLEISQWDMRFTIAAGLASSHLDLLGPKLETLVWDFADVEYDTKGYPSLDEAEAKWLSAFVDAAIARKAALKTVKIHYCPDALECEVSDVRGQSRHEGSRRLLY
ncbi:hypothetical protein EK21DRAFT_108899 [Setomelanomma holmii]|uniref:Uncharacterized protein n=1 Tax=Setomelanomma holmii TaxID=210430 RepID=A0A9P4HE53_9PLEO|nr:hypothetical protein EK21DRAFT_108899 [Setomelanomma holmii]